MLIIFNNTGVGYNTGQLGLFKTRDLKIWFGERTAITPGTEKF